MTSLLPKLTFLIAFTAILSLHAAPKKGGVKFWTDPDKAAAEDPGFRLQGEYKGQYKGSATGLQVIGLGEDEFMTVWLTGGLPGDGWEGKTRKYIRAVGADGKALTLDDGTKWSLSATGLAGDGGSVARVERKSSTLGEKPPEGAVVLFDGTSADAWVKGKLDGEFLKEGTSSKQSFKSFKLHLEFRLPYKPGRLPSNQDRGNSGVYTFNRYETQVLDSFGLHYNHQTKDQWRADFAKEWGTNPQSDRTQWCGSFYKFKTPDINAAYPPLAWQTYDIEFTAPLFEGGKKVKNARFTTRHNGVVIHNDVEMVQGGTGAGRGRGEIPAGQIFLQGHGNPVSFRNIWIVEK
jgi:hypothetical protein